MEETASPTGRNNQWSRSSRNSVSSVSDYWNRITKGIIDGPHDTTKVNVMLTCFILAALIAWPVANAARRGNDRTPGKASCSAADARADRSRTSASRARAGRSWDDEVVTAIARDHSLSIRWPTLSWRPPCAGTTFQRQSRKDTTRLSRSRKSDACW